MLNYLPVKFLAELYSVYITRSTLVGTWLKLNPITTIETIAREIGNIFID